MSLQDKAMLVTLNISAWSARKRDKNVTREVEINHQANDAGNYNKLLIDKSALKKLTTIQGKLRDTHYAMTLPWEDKGARLLPSKMYLEYTRKLATLRGEFDQAVRDFCQGYPMHVKAARTRLGSMYDPEDYPHVSEIKRKFAAKPFVSPVPDAKDFRVDLGKQEMETIKNDIRVQMEEKQIAAMADLWARLKEVVSRIHDRLSDPEATFRDSLIENTVFACSIAEKLNINDDPKLEELRLLIEGRLCSIPAQRLRDDKVLRERVASAAGELLKQFP